MQGTLQDYKSVMKKKGSAGQGDGPMCSNCHQREGHNRLNCPYNECKTFFYCGDITKHANEKATMKQVENRHRQLLKQISTLENDLRVKKDSATSLKSRYVYQVRSMLIESIPARYLTVGGGDMYVEN